MTDHSPNLAALIGSRICHDLISPIGALANGLELLELGGTAQGPEMALVCDSVATANARIRLYRLAFGHCGDAPPTASAEVAAMLNAAQAGRRLALDWQIKGALPRIEAQALVLAVLCLTDALPQGGTIRLTRNGPDGWTLRATGPRLQANPALWACLSGGKPVEIGPAQVQFLMLPRVLQTLGRSCTPVLDHREIFLSF